MMKVARLGAIDYRSALKLQMSLFQARVQLQTQFARGLVGKQDSIPDLVLLVEHSPPVFTMGQRHTDGDLRDGFFKAVRSSASCSTGDVVAIEKRSGIEVVKANRGGGITWHGPGQVTMYPIINVKKKWGDLLNGAISTSKAIRGPSPVRWYSTVLEQAMIRTVNEFLHRANIHHLAVSPGKVGVWVTDDETEKNGIEKHSVSKKVGSIGLHLGNWISMHGCGLNVNNDLSLFDEIVMCEMPDKQATSIHQEILQNASSTASFLPTVSEVATTLCSHFAACIATCKEDGQHVNIPREAVPTCEFVGVDGWKEGWKAVVPSLESFLDISLL